MLFSFRKFLLILTLILLSTASALPAQDTIRAPEKKKKSDVFSRIDLGGYLGLQFGTVTVINIAPLASYRITEKIYAGLGLTYMFYKDNRYTPAFSLSSYGGSIFGGYYIWKELFAHIEYAPLYIPDYYDYYAPITPIQNPGSPWAHDVYIGGGYRQWVGGKAFVNLMVLFNINETEFSPYSNPIIRIGFGVGL